MDRKLTVMFSVDFLSTPHDNAEAKEGEPQFFLERARRKAS